MKHFFNKIYLLTIFSLNAQEVKEKKLILYPFYELPEIVKDGDWVSLLDNQRMETDRKQIEFYDTFIK